MADEPDLDSYALKAATVVETAAPDLPYRPAVPRHPHRIALVGAGGISGAHLEAYLHVGWDVPVICNRTLAKAEAKRDRYYPGSEATDDYAAVLARDDIDIVDLTPHPEPRAAMIRAALQAGKHVLSQKPYVVDLDEGARLADLADERGLVLAVNQNGRWAPHLAWLREAVAAGHVGTLHSVDSSIHWDHSWVGGTAFEDIHDLILYDFAVHRFDFLTSLIGNRATRVYATARRAAGQSIRPPLMAQAVVDWDGGQASILLDGAAKFGPEDRMVVTGTAGTLMAVGPDISDQRVSLVTAAGIARPALEGSWFREGFIGAMAAVMVAAETGARPLNDARRNLDALALVFAAVASTRRGVPVVPGTVRSLSEAMG